MVSVSQAKGVIRRRYGGSRGHPSRRNGRYQRGFNRTKLPRQLIVVSQGVVGRRPRGEGSCLTTGRAQVLRVVGRAVYSLVSNRRLVTGSVR